MIWAIAVGGAAGSVLRYLTSLGMQRASVDFPFGTLLINVVGSLLIGLFARALSIPGASPELRAALTIGFCGGFTTFSTFSAELVALAQQGKVARAAAYVIVSVSLSILATVAGITLGDRWLSSRT